MWGCGQEARSYSATEARIVVKSITKVNPKLKIDCYKKWKCIVGTCDDMINENGCLINN